VIISLITRRRVFIGFSYVVRAFCAVYEPFHKTKTACIVYHDQHDLHTSTNQGSAYHPISRAPNSFSPRVKLYWG